ncbi:MAG: TIGR03067 domain-containing protein [Gemmataceae bacterium]|nr:TIGR03067 domain-containing protein [Gemmataceae bacterium]
MRFVTAVGLVAAMGWVGTADDKKDGGKFDPAALVGTWEIVSGKKMGEKADPEALKKTTFTVKKDGTASLVGPDATFQFKYKLDAKADPVKIDFEITESPFGAGVTAPGIIKVDKGTATLTYAPMGGDRPTKFDDDKAFSFVLKKKDDKKGEAKPATAKE